jgi:DNA polymerase I
MIQLRRQWRVTLADELAAEGLSRGDPLAVVIAAGAGVALAWSRGVRQVKAGDPIDVVRELTALDPRWTWWSARESAAPIVEAGLRLRACWDLGAVGRLLYGLRRDDAAAVWAAAHGLGEPPHARGELDLLDLAGEDGAPLRQDGQLSREWLRGRWADDLDSAQVWAGLALELRTGQEAILRALPDPRPFPRQPPLPLLTALSESAAALLAVELEHDGLPLDIAALTSMLGELVGERPAGASHEAALRRVRDERVLRHFPGEPVDLRNPLLVREMLLRIGVDVPDTRSWRLEPHAASSPAVAALLAWRKAERVATTYGYTWLDRSVGDDGRLRGAWSAADGGAGRMTAQAGLHNMPGELRTAVRAEPGTVFVRGDLGQVEPRVLAAVSGDEGLARAARADDMYAPVAAQLGCDRPTAKVAVLAAMYGQTSGTAGEALKDMDRTYPRAMAYLRGAEEAGLNGTDLRTYGGRLLPGLGTQGTPGHGRYVRNAVIQGAAAELFKAWAVTVRSELASIGGQIVLCLHDELLLQVPEQHAGRAGELLATTLESTAQWWAAGSPVRFVVEVATGDSWAQAH